jgi:hypothetical protein
MIIKLHDLPFRAKIFAEHCLENLSLRQAVEMLYSDQMEYMRAQFDLSEEQCQDALYVVIKEMGR